MLQKLIDEDFEMEVWDIQWTKPDNATEVIVAFDGGLWVKRIPAA
jgi:hypothetical protein